MKRIREIITLFAIAFLLPFTNSFAQSAEEILEQVQQNIRSTTLLSYHADYVNINPMANDSVYKASGTIWLKKISSDSIFGAYFHVKSEDGSGEVDYFYDGQNGYEIRHENKKITMFHPHQYPNTPNNPAKARTALLPFQEILIDDALKKTILRGHPKASIDENQTKWIITLNLFHGERTELLEVDKKTFLIQQFNKNVKWQEGVTLRAQASISDYQRNDSSILDEIFMSKSYAEYSKEEYEREEKRENISYDRFIGEPAPSFSFKSFSGDEISLDQFKGTMVLLDFWESWCGYCIMAIPKLNKLQNQWKDSLTIIGVVTENKRPIEKLIKNNGLIYLNVFADKDILEDYNVSARPTYFLLDQEGKISKVSIGDLNVIESEIHQLIK